MAKALVSHIKSAFRTKARIPPATRSSCQQWFTAVSCYMHWSQPKRVASPKFIHSLGTKCIQWLVNEVVGKPSSRENPHQPQGSSRDQLQVATVQHFKHLLWWIDFPFSFIGIVPKSTPASVPEFQSQGNWHKTGTAAFCPCYLLQENCWRTRFNL